MEDPQPRTVNPHTITRPEMLGSDPRVTLANYSMTTPAGTPQAREINPHGSVGPDGAMPYKYVGGSSSGPRSAGSPISGENQAPGGYFNAGQTASAFAETTARSAKAAKAQGHSKGSIDEQTPTGEPTEPEGEGLLGGLAEDAL
jgi:hypothetical protein